MSVKSRRETRSCGGLFLVVAASVAALMVTVGAGCTRPPEADTAVGGGRSIVGLTQRVDPGLVTEVASRSSGSGRFRMRTEMGVVGQGVVESVVVGAFDESAGSFEAALDLDRLLASSEGLVTIEGDHPVGGDLVVRGAADLVFMKVEGRPWILLPGSLDDVLDEAGIVRPDALVSLLDRVGGAVVADDGDAIDGDATIRYSGWLGRDALDEMAGDNESALARLGAVRLDPLPGVDGLVSPEELLDKMVRFDLWIDAEGRARRLVVELDSENIADIARRVDGTDEGIADIRLRHEVEWFDLDQGVTVEPPPRSEVYAIDMEALRER